MKIRFYGRLAEIFGEQMEVETPENCTVAELRQRLAELSPGHAAVIGGARTRACVGDSLVSDSYVLGRADEVEFIPPVSGG